MLSPLNKDVNSLPGHAEDVAQVQKLLTELSTNPRDDYRVRSTIDERSNAIAERLQESFPQNFKFHRWEATDDTLHLSHETLITVFAAQQVLPYNVIWRTSKTLGILYFITSTGGIVMRQNKIPTIEIPGQFYEMMWALGLTGDTVDKLYGTPYISVPRYLIPPVGLITSDTLTWWYHNSMKLGQGRYGTVYQCDTYAVKKTVDLSYGVSRSLLNEAIILQQLSYPNIIKLIDVVCQPTSMSLILPLTTDGHLRGIYSEAKTKDYTYQLLHGIAYLHSMGVYHGDLKTENCLVFGDRIVIADFGVAHIHRKNQTACHEFFTPNFRAPELALCGEYTPAADIWALGCINYEMLTGKLLFEIQSNVISCIFSTLGRPTEEEWPDMAFLPEWRPEYLKYNSEPKIFMKDPIFGLCRRMLTFNPARRPSAMELIRSEVFNEVRASIPMPESYPVMMELHRRAGERSMLTKPEMKYNSYYQLLAIQAKTFKLTDRTIALAIALMESANVVHYETDLLAMVDLAAQYYCDPRLPVSKIYEPDVKQSTLNTLRRTKLRIGHTTSYDVLVAEANYYQKTTQTYAIKLLRFSYFTTLAREFTPREIGLFCLYVGCFYHDEYWKHAELTQEKSLKMANIFWDTLPTKLKLSESSQREIASESFILSEMTKLRK